MAESGRLPLLTLPLRPDWSRNCQAFNPCGQGVLYKTTYFNIRIPPKVLHSQLGFYTPNLQSGWLHICIVFFFIEGILLPSIGAVAVFQYEAIRTGLSDSDAKR